MKPVLSILSPNVLSILLVSLTAAPTLAHAKGGDKVGGGGDVYRCVRSNGEVFYELLDIAEAEPRGLGVDLGGKKLSIQEKIDLMAARLAEIDPDRAAAYRKEVIQMHEDLQDSAKNLAPRHGKAVFIDKLKEYDDSAETFEKTTHINEKGQIEKVKCSKPMQLVFQKDPVNVTDPGYEFQKDLTDALDADNLVSTYYHEAIYREFRKLNHKNSVSVRSFNSWLFSGRITTLGSCHYLDLLSKAGVNSLKLFGRVNEVSTTLKDGIVCDENGEIIRLSRKDKPYTLLLSGNRQLLVNDIDVQDRVLRSARNLTGFEQEGKKLVPTTIHVTPFANQGTVEFGPGGYARFFNMVKRSDIGGQVSGTWKDDGTFEPFAETGYFNKKLEGALKNGAESLLVCTRDILQKRINGVEGVNFVARSLVEAREAIRRDDPTQMGNLAQECSRYSKQERPARKSHKKEMGSAIAQVSDPAVKKLMSDLFDVRNEDCTMFGVSASAGLVLGAKLGVHGVSCSLSDGRRAVYFGPQAGFQLATIGASVSVGQVKDIKDRQALSKRFGALSGRNGDSGVSLVYVPSENREVAYQEEWNPATSMTEDEAVHVGIRTTMEQYQISGLARVFRKKDDLNYLLTKFQAELLIRQK